MGGFLIQNFIGSVYQMSYSRHEISELIARSKKTNRASRSPSPSSSLQEVEPKRSASPREMAAKYQQLLGRYKAMLQEVKEKNQKFTQQEAQLEKLKAEKQRDQAELLRLRTMIGFIKKQDKGTQLDSDTNNRSNGVQVINTYLAERHDLVPATPAKTNGGSNMLKKRSPNSKELQNTVSHKNGFRAIKTQNLISISRSADKNQSIYSPKTAEKVSSTFFKKQSRLFENKLSNSPYAKLKFSSKIHLEG